MPSPYKQLYIDQGSSFVEVISVVDNTTNLPVNLTNYSIYARMKKGYTSDTYIEFEVSLASANQIKLYLDATTTANITAGRYVYDVVISDGENNRDRIQEGIVIVTPGVTL